MSRAGTRFARGIDVDSHDRLERGVPAGLLVGEIHILA